MAFQAPVGTIPARGFDWEEVRYPARQVGEFVKLLYGKSLVEAKRQPGNVPMYGTNGQCGWHDTPLAKGPGVILGRKGQGHLGVKWCEVPFWVIDTAYFAEVDQDQVDLRWFYYITKYVGLDHLKTGEKPGLSRDVFGRQLFPYPERPVQESIARILGTLDDKIELNRRMNHTLEALARAIFQSWFVDFDPVTAKADGRKPVGMTAETARLFPDSFEDSPLGPIPKGWQIEELRGRASRIQYGLTTSAKVEPLGPRFLRITDIQGGTVDWSQVPHCDVTEEERDKYRVREGDIFIARTGASTGENLYAVDPPDAVFASYLVRLNFEDRAIGRVVGSYLRTQEYFDYIAGVLSGSAQPNANAQVLCAARFCFPPKQVARAFHELVGPLDRAKATRARQSSTLATLRDALLPRLLSGELRVKMAENAVAEAVG